MSRTNSLGYVKEPINPPSAHVDGKLQVDDTINDIDMEDLSSSVSTLETKVASLEGKSGDGVTNGPVPDDFTAITTHMYPSGTTNIASQVRYTYQIIGNRVSMVGTVRIPFETNMNYVELHIPYPVIDGKTYAIKEVITNASELVGFYGISVAGGSLINADFCGPNDASTLTFGWTRPDGGAWTGATTGGSVNAPFSISYIYVVPL